MGEIELYRILRKQAFLKHLNFFAIDLWVSADNLKQVVVEFDGIVDRTTASEEGNYTITGALSPVVHSAVVAEDGRSVTLNLVAKFENQAEYKLSVNNIKAGDTVLNVKDFVFKPLDNTVPTVAKVEALGNKTVRVHFSEPVQSAQTSHFKIDDKVVVGSIQTNLNTVIVKLSSALTDGEHTLTVEGTQDYNNFKTVKTDVNFNVVEDKEAPTVASVVSASFEKVVLKFSEPVEQVIASNIYWMQGASKRAASSVKALADDTYEFTFNDTNKLVYTTDLHVTNVKDYSGNVIDKDTKVQVNPVIDQTRPEVISTSFVKDSNNKQIVIKFTKSLDPDTAKKSANYVIKDKDGKVQYISSTVDVSKDKEVTITLVNTLKDNEEYTLSITGVSDNTTLKNVILPYTTTLSVKDITAPTFVGATRLNNNQLFVEFSEAMATSGDGSVVDAAKYTITNTGVTPNKTLTPASFNVTGDAKGVIISFNDTLPAAGNIKVKVQLVKDLAGNYLSGLVSDNNIAATPTATTVKSVTAVATDKVEVEFTRALQSLNQGDFTVEGHEIAHSELSADGKTATFTLKTDLPENVKNAAGTGLLKLTVVGTPSSVDILGEKVATISDQDITDEIAATVKAIAKHDTSGTKIKITFNEAIDVTSVSEVKTDFVVKDNDGKTVKVTGATVAGGDNEELIVTLERAVLAATVTVKDSRFIVDRATDANAIADIDAKTVELGGDALAASVVTPLAAAGPLTAAGTSLVFSEALDTASKDAVKSIVDGALSKTGDAEFSTAWNAAGTTLTVTVTLNTGSVSLAALTVPASFKVKDLAGNETALDLADLQTP